MVYRTPRPVLIMATLLTLWAAQAAWAQERQGTSEAGPVYVIEGKEYRIEGRTQPFALDLAVEIDQGTRLIGDAALKAFLEDKTQLFINQRVLQSARIEPIIGQARPDGTIPVDLVIYVVDTWNIVALPYPKYDSSNGLDLILKARDYNFLGTMQPLRIDFGYRIEASPLNKGQFNKGELVLEIDPNIPFRAFGLNWNADFDHALNYSPSYGFEYENKTGVSVTVPYKNTELIFGAYQGYSYNEENGDSYKEEYGDRYADHWYLSNWVDAKWKIPTGFDLGPLGEVYYTPYAEVMNKYRPFGDIGYERRGPTLEIGHTLGVSRVDWIENFRRGAEINLDNSFTYNISRGTWDRKVSAWVTGYIPLWSIFGASARIMGETNFDTPDTSAGLPLRGIIDQSLDAKAALYINADFALRVIRFVPYEWFGKNWMKVFQFEQQWSPFMDIGILDDPENGRSFSLQDAVVTAGFEVVTFPLFMRSLYLRISFGFNLRKAIETKGLPSGDDREIFIGLKHQY